MPMELSDATLIDELLQATRPPRKRRPMATAPPALERRSYRRTCHCGACRTCLENARWERIFQQKFADPTYYGSKIPTPGSSLRFS